MSMNPLRKPKPKPPLLTPEWKRRLKIALLCVLGVALLSAAAAYGVKWQKRHPAKPAADAKPVELAKFVASDSFDKLRLSEKEAMLETIRPGPGVDPRVAMKDLSEAERHTVFEKMMQVREAKANKQARDYFKLPKDKREAWMVNYVAEQDKRRAEMRERFKQMRQQRGQGQGGAGVPPPGGPPPP